MTRFRMSAERGLVVVLAIIVMVGAALHHRVDRLDDELQQIRSLLTVAPGGAWARRNDRAFGRIEWLLLHPDEPFPPALE